MLNSLRRHYPEYLIEAVLAGLFVVSICGGVGAVRYHTSPIIGLPPLALRLILGIVVGVAFALLVYSPLGKRSGAHMNPVVTLTYLRLGKIHPWDAAFYACSQFAGAIAGVGLAWLMMGPSLTATEVNFAVTVPRFGAWTAFMAELLMSTGLMTVVLHMSNRKATAPYTGVTVGIILAVYVTLESPLSGTSMNPARSLGTAVWANVFRDLWVYFSAPVIGMLLAAEMFLWRYGADAIHCAKLHHTGDVRCIFKCGYARGTDPASEVRKPLS